MTSLFQENKIEVDDIKQLPIYINDDTTYVASVIDRTTGKRVNKVTKVPFTKTRGSINIDNNELTVSKIKSRWKNAVAIEKHKTQLLLTSIAIP